jgi:hypothetical protein
MTPSLGTRHPDANSELSRPRPSTPVSIVSLARAGAPRPSLAHIPRRRTSQSAAAGPERKGAPRLATASPVGSPSCGLARGAVRQGRGVADGPMGGSDVQGAGRGGVAKVERKWRRGRSIHGVRLPARGWAQRPQEAGRRAQLAKAHERRIAPSGVRRRRLGASFVRANSDPSAARWASRARSWTRSKAAWSTSAAWPWISP